MRKDRISHAAPDLRGLTSGAVAVLIVGTLLFAAIIFLIENRNSREVKRANLEKTATILSGAITTFRDFYSQIILDKLHGTGIEVSHDYREKPHAVPIPATMSLDLIEFFNERKMNASMRLVSDYPFPWRRARLLENFDRAAFERFRSTANEDFHQLLEDGKDSRFEFAVPIRMGENCVACHNSHPDSPKRDWRIGDVRGIQIVSLRLDGIASKDLERRSYFIISLLMFLAFTVIVVAWLIQRNQLAFRRIMRDQRRLAEARDQADSANRAKTAFLANISHELRTPLNAILGHAQLFSDAIRSGPNPGTPETRRHLEQIEQSGWHLLSLIEEVLDLSKIEGGTTRIELEPIALDSLLVECCLLIEAEARKRHVTLRAPIVQSSRRYGIGNSTTTRQILLNLLSNAVKYNREGGYVELRLRDGGPGRIQICIRDSGRGLARSELESLFSPFTRFTKPDEVIPGSGIGLALSKRLAELMRGTLEAHSEVDKGSEFILTLDAAEPPPEVNASGAVQPGFVVPLTDSPTISDTDVAIDQPEPVKVLYVEDTLTNYEVVRLFLEKRKGFEIRNAPDGDAALRLARSMRPNVILLDMNLPGMSGMEVKERLALDPATSRIPIIALTASALREDVNRAREAGFSDYLTKPVQFSRLLTTLQSVVRASSTGKLQ